MPVPLTLVLALTSVAARTRRTHPIAPNPTVLLCEHIWWLEDEVEYILKHDWDHDELHHCDHDEVLHQPEKYMLEHIKFFAMRLWKGEHCGRHRHAELGNNLQGGEHHTGSRRHDWRRPHNEIPKCSDGRLPIPNFLQVDAAVYATFDAR